MYKFTNKKMEKRKKRQKEKEKESVLNEQEDNCNRFNCSFVIQ